MCMFACLSDTDTCFLGARLKAAELADSSSKYPFQEHLVHLQREVEPPRYLLEKGTDLFDMSLLSQVSEEDSEEEDSEEKDSDEKKNSFEYIWIRFLVFLFSFQLFFLQF